MEALWEALNTWGVPAAITGLLAFFLKRYVDRRDKEREERDDKLERLMVLIMKNGRANNVLAVATAKAVQRIPDAHCNGDMTTALEEAAKIQNEEKELLVDEGIKHIFGD